MLSHRRFERQLLSPCQPVVTYSTSRSRMGSTSSSRLLGLMAPDTRLPIVQLGDAAKTEVANAIVDLTNAELTSDALRATLVPDHACNAPPGDRP